MSLSEHASVPPSVSFLGSVPPYYYKTYYISTRRLWYTGLVYNVTQGSRRKMCKKHTSSTSLAASRCSFPHSHKGMLTFLLQKPLHLLYRWVNCMTVNYTVSWMHQQKVPGAKKAPKFNLATSTVSFLEHRRRAGYVEAPLRTWPERDKSVPKAKSSHAALKTESDSSLHKNFQGFGTCISYMLSKSHSSAF